MTRCVIAVPLAADRIVAAFVTLIVAPLLAAFLTERWAERRATGRTLIGRLSWLPVPLLAVVVFLIASSQVQAVAGALPVLGRVAGLFIAYLFAAALIGRALAALLGLAPRPARALIFGLGTRNSFVVLPLVLALEAPWQAAVVVIVFQSLVELFGMLAYLWALPRFLVPSPPIE